MRRKSVAWMAAGATIVVVGVVLAFGRPAGADFKFLKGAPVSSGLYGQTTRYHYTMSADIGQFLKSAEPELWRDGYQLFAMDQTGFRYFHRASDDAVVFISPGKWSAVPAGLTSPDNGMIDRAIPNWVTISTQRPGLWNRLTRWVEQRVLGKKPR